MGFSICGDAEVGWVNDKANFVASFPLTFPDDIRDPVVALRRFSAILSILRIESTAAGDCLLPDIGVVFR